MESLIKLKKYKFVIRRVRELYTVKMTVTFAGDLADLRLTWYSREVFSKGEMAGV